MTQSQCTSELEDKLRARGYMAVAGIDEAGRGSLAGPVVAACVVPGEGFLIEGIRDSKKLTPARREEIYERIISVVSVFGVGIVNATEIDRINILQATLKAMKIACDCCDPGPDYLLVDGDKGFETSLPGETLVGGDDISVAVAAASIVAKVTRDKMMVEFAIEYPEYGFETHKGYGTESHLAAIREHGPSPIHRMSFAPMSKSRQGTMFDGDQG